MGMGKRRGRRGGGHRRRHNRHLRNHRRRQNHRHGHHRSRTHNPAEYIFRKVVPGTLKERMIYTTVSLTSLFLIISGSLTFMSLTFVGPTWVVCIIGASLIFLGIVFSFWAKHLSAKLQQVEAEISSRTAPTAEEGASSSNSMQYSSEIGISRQLSDNALPNNSSIFTVESEQAGVPHATLFRTGSLPNIAATASTNNHFPGQYGNIPPTDFAGPPLYNMLYTNATGNGIGASFVEPTRGESQATVVEVEPPPPSYEDVINNS